MVSKSDWEIFCERFNLTQKQMGQLTIEQWEEYFKKVAGDKRLEGFVSRNLQRLGSKSFMLGCSSNNHY